MLHFRGSDCKRSSSSTWYERMENFLMVLGFTKSKEYSNIYFKVEGRRPVMLLLYVDDLLKMKEGDLLLSSR